MKQSNEKITEAAQTADLLVSDLRQAHKQAGSPAEDMILLDLIKKACQVLDALKFLEV